MATALFSSIPEWIPSLFWSTPCLLCSCCPTGRNSIVTRLVYSALLLFYILVAFIMLVPGVEQQISKVQGLCEGNMNCRYFTGYKAIYHIFFGMASFHLLLAFLMINVKNSKDPRALVHNGFWIFKVFAAVIIIVCSFYIPEEYFSKALFVVGSAGAFCFTLIQLVVLIDVGFSWNAIWRKKNVEGGTQCWQAAVVSVTCFNYMVSLATVILCYIFYISPGSCIQHIFFLVCNTGVCILASLISLHPKVQASLLDTYCTRSPVYLIKI
ncbi:serine incorporator 1-like [Acipenser ruthenus]|uniref:serine incorporator 1-like n=1 Tax=Acipenser ruthenus TaxID=7906 RepID=UPI002740A9F2|nr:serine incorporator 1-like [Acipenser ruthenus]